MQAGIYRDTDGIATVDDAIIKGVSRDADGFLQLDDTLLQGGLTRDTNSVLQLSVPMNAHETSATVDTFLDMLINGVYSIDVPFVINMDLSDVTKNYLRTIVFPLHVALQRQRLIMKTRNFTAAMLLKRQRLIQVTKRFSQPMTLVKTSLIKLIKKFSSTLTVNIQGQSTVSAAAEIEISEDLAMQVLRGRYGMITVSYRISRSNIRGEDLGPLNGYIVGSGGVNMSNFRDHAWEVTFDWLENDEIDPVRDWVKVYADVEIETGMHSYPLGLYRLAKPSGTLSRELALRHLSGFSPEFLIARSEPNVPVSYAANTDVLAAVTQILVAFGVPADRILFPATVVRLRNTMQFDPTSDASGSSWLAICNALLNAGGFYALQTDSDGRFTSDKMGSNVVMEPDVAYDGEYEAMVTGSITDDWNDDRFANRVLVRSQDIADTPPLFAVAENRNPASEGSYDFLGYWVQKTINLQSGATQADLATMAQAELEKASGYYRKLTLTGLFDPRVFAPRRIYGLTLYDRDDELVISGRWNQISLNLPLSNPPTAMTHEVSRVEEV